MNSRSTPRFRSVKHAYQYFTDDRSHGDEYLAAAAEVMWLGLKADEKRSTCPIATKEFEVSVKGMAKEMERQS